MADYGMELDENEALAALNATRSKLAEQVRSPLIWHVAFASVFGAEVAAQGLPMPWSSLATGALTLAIFGVVFWSKVRRGLWVNGWRGKSTRWVTALVVMLFAAAIIGSVVLYRTSGDPSMSMALGGATFVLMLCLSLLKERLYRHELEASR